MNNKENKIINETKRMILEEELEKLYEMSNIDPSESGLKTKLHLMPNGASSGMKHWARVKVVLSDKSLFPIKVNDNGDVEPVNKDGAYDRLDSTDKRLVDDAAEYTRINKDIIMAYWYGKFPEYILHDILRGRITLEDALKETY